MAIATAVTSRGAAGRRSTPSRGPRSAPWHGPRRRSRPMSRPRTTVRRLRLPYSGWAPPPAVLGLCVSCHETDVAPRIHFSDPKLLTQQLGERSAHGTLYDEIRFRLSAGAGAHRMPLGLNLADADRRALEAYFASLTGSAN